MKAEKVERLDVSVFTIPTDKPESDGTLEWDSTTLVLVRLRAGKVSALGYSYAHGGCATLIRENLFPLISGGDAMNIAGLTMSGPALLISRSKQAVQLARIA